MRLVLELVAREADRATERYGAPTSTHEALGVLIEECDELRDAIHRNSLIDVRAEAIQVAAVALRLATACAHALSAPAVLTPFARRSGAT